MTNKILALYYYKFIVWMGSKMGSFSQKKKKVSVMLMDVAAGYVAMGEDFNEKLALLNEAAIAWNLACMKMIDRKKALKSFLKTYKKNNPDTWRDDIEAVKDNINMLIERKLELYPNENISIVKVDAEIVKGDKLKVYVASARDDNN